MSCQRQRIRRTNKAFYIAVRRQDRNRRLRALFKGLGATGEDVSARGGYGFGIH